MNGPLANSVFSCDECHPLPVRRISSECIQWIRWMYWMDCEYIRMHSEHDLLAIRQLLAYYALHILWWIEFLWVCQLNSFLQILLRLWALFLSSLSFGLTGRLVQPAAKFESSSDEQDFNQRKSNKSEIWLPPSRHHFQSKTFQRTSLSKLFEQILRFQIIICFWLSSRYFVGWSPVDRAFRTNSDELLIKRTNTCNRTLRNRQC